MPTVYCLHVTERILNKNAVIINFDFGKFETSESPLPYYINKLDKKFPFLLKQSADAIDQCIGVHHYGTVIMPARDENISGVKLQIVPCGDISYLSTELRDAFKLNGYIETDSAINPAYCETGMIYTIGAESGNT